MASINHDRFYINLVSLEREEAATILAALISLLSVSDEELENWGTAIGLEGDIRGMILNLGSKIDDEWNDMLRTMMEVMNS